MPLHPSISVEGLSDPEWVAVVRSYVDGLRYGYVQLVVHDGRVTQIERTEKVRLSAQAEPPVSKS